MTIMGTMALMTIMNVMALSSMSYAIFDILVIIVVMNMVIMAAAMAITAGMAILTVGCSGRNGLHDYNCCNGYNFSRGSCNCIAFIDPNGNASCNGQWGCNGPK